MALKRDLAFLNATSEVPFVVSSPNTANCMTQVRRVQEPTRQLMMLRALRLDFGVDAALPQRAPL